MSRKEKMKQVSHRSLGDRSDERHQSHVRDFRSVEARAKDFFWRQGYDVGVEIVPAKDCHSHDTMVITIEFCCGCHKAPGENCTIGVRD